VTNDADLELRAVSDRFLANLDRLYELENLKRALPTGTKRFIELAAEVRTLTQAVLTASARQEALASSAEYTVGADGPSGAPIDDLPRSSVRRRHEILTDWRAAERRLAQTAPGTAEYARQSREVEALRYEYRVAEARDREQSD